MLRPVLVTPAAEDAASIDEVKDDLQIRYTDDDDKITRLIKTAIQNLDGYRGILGRCLVNQVWRSDFKCWGEFRLRFPDVSEFTVKYLDENGDEQTVADGNFRLADTHSGPWVYPIPTWTGPTLLDGHHAPISVTYTAGFGAASDVPQALKNAISMHVGTMYDNSNSHSEKTPEMNHHYYQLISNYRWSNL